MINNLIVSYFIVRGKNIVKPLSLKVIIHFAAAVADSNHEQEWGLIKSGKGREEERRRRGGTTICNRCTFFERH